MTAPTLPARAIGPASSTQATPAQGSNFLDGQARTDAHTRFSVEESISAPAKPPAAPSAASSVRNELPAQAIQPPAPMAGAPAQGMTDPMLALLADVLDDLERTRIANENRLRQLTRDEDDSDGINRGFGLTTDQPQVASVLSLVNGLAAMEHQATLALQRAVRQHPLGGWIKTTAGVGEKQGARLLAAIGDPYWNSLHDRPRTVSELWAFSGYHVLRTGHSTTDAHGVAAGADRRPGGGDTSHSLPDTQDRSVGVATSRTRGQRANWSPTTKMRAYLVAEACMKCRQSPYRAVYDDTRLKYADAIHNVECRRCGPSGKPAPAGSPLSDGHKHARALRAVAKEVLRDLWRESKRIHDENASRQLAPRRHEPAHRRAS